LVGKNGPRIPEAARRVGANTGPVVTTCKLSKRYPGRGRGGPAKLAVDTVDLQLHDGEIFGLVGPNGAGKTTLIRLLSGMLLPTSGAATVGGFDIVTASRSVRRLVGLVSSNERSFYWRLTGRQNLCFFADLYRIPKMEARAWMAELMELLDVGDVADVRFDQYSTGQRQRMAIARGLLSKPKILLMDEPTKGVDPIGASQLVHIIRDRIVKLWHPTILVTSHNLVEIERLCRRIALMAEGRIVAMGEIDELRGMVGKTDVYRLRIAKLSTETLETIATDSGALQPIRIFGCGDAAELEVGFPRDTGGLACMIRLIVQAGGDVSTCSAVEASFEDVFHTLVARQTGKHGKGRSV
jgi:ABC-2 type transport system ATP-binding protein